MQPRLRYSWLALAVLGLCASGNAQTGADAVADRVEEDWQVVVGDPDPFSTGPQITTCVRPVTGSRAFVAFCLNYRDDPVWQPGGLQVKAYSESTAATQEQPLLDSNSESGDALATDGETITWTQRLSVSSGIMSFSVRNGSSTTWGGFGNGDDLKVSFSTNLTDLGSYTPDDSVKFSAAGWQANRVASMTLLRVRYYQAGVLIATDDSPRVVTLSATAPSTTN